MVADVVRKRSADRDVLLERCFSAANPLYTDRIAFASRTARRQRQAPQVLNGVQGDLAATAIF
jgi:hypothetical protein